MKRHLKGKYFVFHRFFRDRSSTWGCARKAKTSSIVWYLVLKIAEHVEALQSRAKQNSDTRQGLQNKGCVAPGQPQTAFYVLSLCLISVIILPFLLLSPPKSKLSVPSTFTSFRVCVCVEKKKLFLLKGIRPFFFQ